MAMFFEHHETEDKVVYRPIGRRAGLLGLASYALTATAWIAFVFQPDNLFILGMASLATLWMIVLPHNIAKIDGLPGWSLWGQGRKFRSLALFTTSLKRKSIVVSKAQNDILEDRGRKTSVYLESIVTAGLFVAELLLHYVFRVF